MARRRIAVITGGRADYGLLLPLMRALRSHPDFRLQVVVTGMHLAPAFGETWRFLEDDGFTIDARVDMLLASDSPGAIAKSVGLGVIGFSDALLRLSPDLVVLLGDRFEIFAAAQAAMFLGIPVAHIAGGDVTEGAVDEMMRHAITKMAQIHFVTHEQARRRVIQLGEPPEHVHLTGSPGIDLIMSTPRVPRETLSAELGFHFRNRNLLITFHPATLEPESPGRQVRELLSALDRFDSDVGLIFTLSNADSGGQEVNREIERFVATRETAIALKAAGARLYYSLLAEVDAVVGNSSSGLYEAPSFGIPTVNIGDRQKGRVRAESVLDCAPEREAIKRTIDRALEMDCSEVRNPYGDGRAVERMLRVLQDPATFRMRPQRAFHDLDCDNGCG